MAAFRVFLSAVSSEFAQARDALASDLQSHEVTVSVQRSFRHDDAAETLLHKLRNYIEHCDVVVCLIGARSGAGLPVAVEAAAFRDDLPVGITEASYTQWEFFFARRFNRRCLVYLASSKFRPDKRNATPEDRPDLQAAFVAYVKALGVQRTAVGSLHEFRAEALKDLLQGPLPAALSVQLVEKLAETPSKLILLPYPSLETLFKGRDAFLRRLRASLTRPDGGAAAIAGRAVHGLGGVGKTRAAVEYAWAHRADYTALALLDAETGEKLRASLAALVGPLHLPEQATPDEAARVEAALAWLNANPDWLLILDNVDSEPALDAANRLLGRLQGGHVVLTSRLARFPRGVERLDLDVLSLDDAAAFLLEATEGGRHTAADDAVQAAALGEELGQLALALEMAAATIEARGLGFAAYRALWLGNRARVVGWAGEKITGYHHAVAETWQTSVDQLSEAARHLLERLAFLAPDPVPGFLLDVAVPGAEAKDATAALDDLAAYSLVTRDVEGETFLVHRLVQDVTRRGLEASGTTAARLTESLGWVDAAFTGEGQDARSWGRLDPLAPHAEAVAAHANAAGIANPTARLMNELGVLFSAKAVYARADLLFRRALAIDEANLGKDHPTVATDLNNLAELLRATNRLGKAEPLFRCALAIDEASLGKDHPTVARDLNNLAELLRATNRLGEAEPLFRRALAIGEASLGKDHPEVATDLNNLAGLLGATNRLGEAEPLYRRALAIDEASLGKDHPNVATYLNNLALLLHATNRPGEAESLFRRALVIFLALERAIGREHPTRVTVQGNYEGLLAALGRSQAEIAAAIAALDSSA
jgi:tetratricopeptide (TPR) repeat protein